MLYGEIRGREESRFLEELPGDVSRIDEGSIAPSIFERETENDEFTWEAPRRPPSVPRRAPPVTVARRRAVVPGTLPGLARGSRVRHPTYGPGVILQQEGTGEEARLTVFFDRAGKKKFVAKFANLTPA
jgi:DNA helicase-2/ATP-dependent DNA helicase PcrA